MVQRTRSLSSMKENSSCDCRFYYHGLDEGHPHTHVQLWEGRSPGNDYYRTAESLILSEQKESAVSKAPVPLIWKSFMGVESAMTAPARLVFWSSFTPGGRSPCIKFLCAAGSLCSSRTRQQTGLPARSFPGHELVILLPQGLVLGSNCTRIRELLYRFGCQVHCYNSHRRTAADLSG